MLNDPPIELLLALSSLPLSNQIPRFCAYAQFIVRIEKVKARIPGPAIGVVEAVGLAVCEEYRVGVVAL